MSDLSQINNIPIADLIVVAGDGAGTARKLRHRDAPSCDAAIVRVGIAPGPERELYDETVPAIDREGAAALLARWAPLRLANLPALEAAFGQAEVASLLRRLRDQLGRVHMRRADGDAHRLSGIAGMLGFAELAAAWQCVDRGEADAERLARIETRRALTAIAKRLR